VRHSTAGLVPAVVSAATFATSGAFATSLLRAGWSPGAAVTARVVIAALILLGPALLALRGDWSRLRRGSRSIPAYGLVAVAGCQLCYFNAVGHLSVAVALLLEYSGALLVVLWLWLRHGQRPQRLTVAGAAVAVAGLVLVLDLVGDQHVDLAGVLWGVGAATGLAVYFVLSAAADDALPPLVVAGSGLLVGSVGLLAAGAVGVLPLRAPRTDVVLLHTRVSWIVPVLVIAVVATVVAYVSGILAARELGAKVASFIGLTEVLFAVTWAWLLLGERLRPVQLGGGVLVVAGIALVRLDQLRAEQQQPPAVPADPGRHPAALTG
jgi:drug/metabolite transporter (DMT)-like permease